ncbi:hypothetical protein [Flagellimonas myxillae]|uniref:hypothetical protein n=1 Tax=Flagellimonas myxillae TaxID=2942214 RepID=UPI00201F5690|nr:hypothetical protein [Muricauda myxillae]MCL6266150.1 hypothetical protein [Muricauda myxillae]
MTIQKLKIIVCLVLVSSAPMAAQNVEKERPERLDQLMKAVGNEESWRNAKGFYMLEIAHYANLKLPLVRRFWIDFENPRIKMASRNANLNEVRALNKDNGWTLKGDELTIWDEGLVNRFRSFWPGIPSRIFHLLASDDPSLTYEILEDRINFSVDGKFAVWIATDEIGNPVAYGRSSNHKETHFLGEILDYGPVKLWKEAFEPGGQWRVVMVDYELLTDMSDISYATPK